MIAAYTAKKSGLCMTQSSIKTTTSSDARPAMEQGSVSSLLQWLGHGAGRAQALTGYLLQRADQTQAICAYIHIAKEQAQQQALQCDALQNTAGQQLLRGLPLVVKDNVDVYRMPTTSGSKAFYHLATRSASAVERLQQAGAVVLGKVNLHELCFGITSNNAAYGAVRNPYAPDHIAGGSSGGTAAAIAAGLAPAGIGSDTGGSLRIPAALCGVVGFRPTTGRWPSDGVAKISTTRDTLGPMGRTVADCALLDAVVCGDEVALPPIALKGLRIGVPQTMYAQPVDAQIKLAIKAVFAQLKAAGVELIPCDLGIDEAACDHAGMVVATYESVPCIESYLTERGLPFDPVQFTAKIASPDVRGIFESLIAPGARDEAAYLQALNVQRPLVQRAYANCFAQHAIEALIFPTTPLPATPIGPGDEVLLGGQSVPAFPAYTRYVAAGSFSGQPGISLPMGCTAQGLPMGIALDGPAGSDRRVLAIAQAIESLIGRIPAAPHSL